MNERAFSGRVRKVETNQDDLVHPSIPFMASWNRCKNALPLRKLYLRHKQQIALFLMCSFVCGSAGAVDFTVKSSDVQLQRELIANTTNTYNGTLTPGLFAGNYSFTVTSKKPSGPPPPLPNPVSDGTAFDRCFVHGWVFGSENERADVIGLIQGAHYDISKSTTCGGSVVSAGRTAPQAFLDGCSRAYHVAVSTINLRDGMDPPVLIPPFPPLP